MVTKFLSRLFLRPMENILWQLDDNEQKLYLTFDDGPFPEVTDNVLNILASQNVPATFFLSGIQLEMQKDRSRKLDYGIHEIGNHGYFHAPWNLKSQKTLTEEIERTDKLIQKFFERKPRLYRPPYGLWGQAVEAVLQQPGKKMVLWSLLSRDYKWPVSRVLDYLSGNLESGDIIVFHDSGQSRSTVTEALPRFIDDAHARGFHFAHIPDF